jgi:C4-dicarboxylate-specific signal transduction histidine kinase
VNRVVTQAEAHEARVVAEMVMLQRRLPAPEPMDETIRRVTAQLGSGVALASGTAARLNLDPTDAELARERSASGAVRTGVDGASALAFDPTTPDLYLLVTVQLAAAREAVVGLYILMTLALLAVYALVALALELFVLPQHVYGPIRTVLEADRALQEGRPASELIPEHLMPADELGEIMRSRNSSISALRRHEAALAAALAQLETIATDLRRKNHLLEMARRNLADADRLASLGMMSAGIAHELNTPLAVLKGLVERLDASLNGDRTSAPPPPGPAEAALMLRVVGRLERLSEGLLDFARIRPHRSVPTPLRPLIDEAWTLVRLDRGARSVELVNLVPSDLTALVDPDRLVQVLVNLLRNAVDAMTGAGPSARPPPRLEIAGTRLTREGRPWSRLTVADNGPGFGPEILARLFQPFVSTRLDADGTGLGLAVAHGIVREHGGLLMARNKEGSGGAVFEILLPEEENQRPSTAGDAEIAGKAGESEPGMERAGTGTEPML